jgi:hypothetical protein
MLLPVGKPETLVAVVAVVAKKGRVHEVGFNDRGTMSAVVATTEIEDGTTNAAWWWHLAPNPPVIAPTQLP